MAASRISGAQPSRLLSSVMTAWEALLQLAGDGRRHGVAEALPRREGVVDRGRLVTAVDHAVLALLVAARAPVLFPPRRLHQLLERRGVALLQQVAGPLPAEEVV